MEKIDGESERIKQFYKKLNTDQEKNDEAKELLIDSVSRVICRSFGISYQVIKNRIRSEKLDYLFER